MLYNIMIINMAHVEIDRYKIERQFKYSRMLSDYSQFKVLANNDLHGYYKFIKNFYDLEG